MSIYRSEPTFYQKVAKGIVTPKNISIHQTLLPSEVDYFINEIKEQSSFLSKISAIELIKLRGNVSLLETKPRLLVRVNEGSEPSERDLGRLDNQGKQFDCLPMQAFFTLAISTISNNADDPEFESKIDKICAAAVGNDILDIAWNGRSDSGESFLDLNEGWLILAEYSPRIENIPVKKNTPISQICVKLLEAMPSIYKYHSSFIMSKSNHEKMIMELSSINPGLSISGDMMTYMGYPIEVTPYLPEDKIIMTPLSNLGWGINRSIHMSREESGRKRAIEYTFDMAMDFQLIYDDAFRYCTIEKDK